MGSVSYVSEGLAENPFSPEQVLPFTILANRDIHTRNGYHCRALLLPYPHSLCSAILEPALLRTLLPDFNFLASFQLGLGPDASATSASSTVPAQQDDDVQHSSELDAFSEPRPLHHPSRNSNNNNQNLTLQQLSVVTQREIVFLYPGGGNGSEFLLRHGPNPQLVRAPSPEEQHVDDDQPQRPLQLYPRLPSPSPSRSPSSQDEGQSLDPEETSNLEDVVRQMITHHPERRLENTFHDLLHQSHPHSFNSDNYGLATTIHDGLETPDPYPFRVPSECFRIPTHPTGDTERVDAMTLQRSRFLPSQSDGEEAVGRGMVLGIAINFTLADAAGVETIVARLRREILREVGGVWEER
ncbi:hypothetical protein B0T20DRAFT_78402 [Sordaria brevicollis]|uniref:Uncharacterized protein n=1 Tax=Sordaria brevicollis TaxID=83679 RepID=A0AAE0U5A5_SORBR|nr:hypothetical protein B0T20DRAFT_78402 [Sordaria brevicollis]